jgi:hypothetical protein
VGVGNVVLNLFGFSIIYSVNSVFESLAGQMLSENNYSKVAMTFSRAKLVYVISFCFIVIIIF